MVNTQSSKYNVVATLSADVIMLLIMVVRLFYIRLTGGMLGLGRFLLTQVGLRLSSLAVVLII